MPSSVVKSFSKKTNKSVKEVEKLWHRAKELAAEQGHTEEYDYITGILKRMLKLENISFSDIILVEDMYNEVGKIVKKKLKEVVYFDDKLFRDEADNEFTHKDYIIYYSKSRTTSDGDNVYKYNFTFK